MDIKTQFSKNQTSDKNPMQNVMVIDSYPIQLLVDGTGGMWISYDNIPQYQFPSFVFSQIEDGPDINNGFDTKLSHLFLNIEYDANSLGKSIPNPSTPEEFTFVSNTLSPDSLTIITHFKSDESDVDIVQRTIYNPGDNYYTLQWEITNNSNESFTNCSWVHGGRSFFIGKGDFYPGNNMVFIKKTDITDYPFITKNTNDDEIESRGIMGLYGDVTTPIDHFYEGHFEDNFDQMESGILTDNLIMDTTQAGYSVQWNKTSLSPGETWTIIGYEMFSNSDVVLSVPLYQNADRNETKEIKVAIQNLFLEDDLFDNALNKTTSNDYSIYNLSAETYHGWDVNVIPSTIELGYFETDTFIVEITTPYNPTSSIEDFVVIAEHKDYSSIEDYKLGLLSVPAIALYYVDSSATGTNDGSSWTNAFSNLQEALNTAYNGDQIWVAAGTYFPYSEEMGETASSGKNGKTMSPAITPRDYYFEIPSGVAVYGGFNGTETALDERDNIKGNPTILSGDIQQDNIYTNNSYNVVVIEDADSTTILDGFTIKHGYADGSPYSNKMCGGGLTVRNSEPKVHNCTITDNYAELTGSGLQISAEDYNESIEINPEFYNCYITNNYNVGGIQIRAASQDVNNPTFINCVISGNYSKGTGGGIKMESHTDQSCRLTIINSTISGNRAKWTGGGIYHHANASGVFYVELVNTILWYNSDNYDGYEIYLGEDCTFIIKNCILKGGLEGISADNIAFAYYSLRSDDPIFYSPIDPAGAPTEEGNYRLDYGTPVKNAGIEIQGITPDFDIAGVARDTIDIGAYEFKGALASNQFPDFEVEVGEHFMNTQIPLRNIFFVPNDANAPIIKSLELIEDSVTARYCCCCSVDTLIFGGINNDILYLNYFKHADGFGTVTLKGEWNGYTKYVEFDVEVVSVIPGDTINYDGDTTSLALEEELLPTEFHLSQNYPNPFNPTTLIPFSLPESAPVTLTIYDLNGKIVKTLIAGQLNAGYHKFEIDATKFSTGIYFYRLQAGSFSDIKKMTIIK